MVTNIDELKSQSIVQVIERYLPLQKSGQNHIACCPFHSEKSPSFVVSEAKGLYKCFGCGKSGDALEFIKEYEKLDFYQALTRLSELVNIPLHHDKQTPSPSHPSQVLEKIAQAAQENLASHPQILESLHARGLTKQMIKTYEYGLMPSKQELLKICTKQELESSTIINTQGQNLSVPMHHRILIPIRNPQHKLIAFVARTHAFYKFAPNAPKYINSKESYFYKKTQTLYLYSKAKKHINEHKKALVVEGYIDSQLLQESGYPYTIATGGTAFNAAHLSLLLKSECEIIFCFDNDKSGMQANFRALKVCFNAQFFNAKIALLQNKDHKGRICKDINDALLTGKALEFRYMSGFEFFIKYLYKHSDKKSAFNAIKSQLQAITNYYDKQELLHTACALTQIPAEYFTQETAPQRARHQIHHAKFIDLISSILNSDDCAYIASELDLSFLPKDLQDPLKLYLETKAPSKELAAFIQGRVLDTESFYLHYLDLHLAHLHQEQDKARAKRDLSLTYAISEKIAQIKHDIQSVKAF